MNSRIRRKKKPSRSNTEKKEKISRGINTDAHTKQTEKLLISPLILGRHVPLRLSILEDNFARGKLDLSYPSPAVSLFRKREQIHILNTLL